MNTFSLNIFNKQIENTKKLNIDLLKTCKKIYKTTKSVTCSNIGYQSDKVSVKKYPVFLDLYQKLEDNVRANLSVYDLKEINLDFTLPWININKPGDFNWPHIHMNPHFSGLYYLKVPKNSGDIVFYNSFHEGNSFYNKKFNKYNSHNSSSFSYGPQESTFLMFPGNVKHAVKRNESKQDRISIAFDINLK